MTQVALLTINTVESDEPTVDQLLLFPNREAALAKFVELFSPEGEYADIDAAGRDFDQLLNDLRARGIADTGEGRIYILKWVDCA